MIFLPGAFLLAIIAQPTWHQDIRPIFDRRCNSCHRKGEIAPFPLTTHQEARPWARAIRQAIVQKKMPPWFVEHSSEPLADDRQLAPGEYDTILAWVNAGTPAGTPDPSYRPPVFTAGWQIRPPNQVLVMEKAVAIPARGELDYQFIVLPYAFPEDRWVTAAELRPSARDVVHHAIVYIRESGDPWLRGSPSRVTTSDILVLYTPGNLPMSAPPGMAKKIPAGADLVLQMHYTPNGKPVRDLTRLGLVFADAPPTHRVLTLQLNNITFRIPAGDSNYRASVSGTLPNPALLLSFFPHLHLRGKAFEYELLGESGQVETLLRVAPYNFYWQMTYRLATPRALPKGARLRATAWYDNSANNPRNPDPAAEVTYGEPSTAEMLAGFFDVAVPPETDKKTFFLR